jgi:molybdenum cofactor cytidylyltransferase
MTFALIPAAGTSSRMGRPKLALPLGQRTVLGHVLEALRQAGVEQVLVVVGAHVPELVPIAETAGADTLLLAEPTPDMRATVERGLRWIQDHYGPRDHDKWLLMPADHPTLSRGIIEQLLRAYDDNPDRSIIVPIYEGRRGHPALLAWKHVAEIFKLPSHQGLNVYLRRHAHATLEVAVDSPDILVDLDTPDDYAALQYLWQNRSDSRAT